MTLSPKIKKHLSTFGRVAFSVALLGYVFSLIDLQQTVAVVRSASLIHIFYAFLTFVVINVLLVSRWQVFLKALGLRIPLLSVARYYLIGLFGNLFLPSAIGGDVVKVVGLSRYSAEPSKTVASVLLDRLSGFAGMVLVATLAFALGYRLINDLSILVFIGIMALGSVTTVVVLFNERIYSFCCRIFTAFPRVKKGLMRVHYDTALLRGHWSAFLKTVGLSCLAQMVFAVTFFLLARALHQDIRLIYLLIFMPLICVASAFPSIGGLGVREAGTAFLFAKVGIDPGVAVSISLINFLFMVTAGLFGGLIYTTTRPPELSPVQELRATT